MWPFTTSVGPERLPRRTPTTLWRSPSRSSRAPLVLGRQVGRALGEEGLSVGALQRLALPAMELLTHGLYTGTELLEATRAAMGVGS